MALCMAAFAHLFASGTQLWTRVREELSTFDYSEAHLLGEIKQRHQLCAWQ